MRLDQWRKCTGSLLQCTSFVFNENDAASGVILLKVSRSHLFYLRKSVNFKSINLAMRIHPIPFTILFCLFSIFSFSQRDTSFALQLRSGKIFTEKNITQENVKSFTERLQKVNGKSFAVLQFEQLPSDSRKQELAAAGVQLL